ncbi:MAG: hypothetical protein GWO19_15370, partial [Nitrospinaceae bacterium]|nr:hypothetical protein [Nitrospinaceae bacterium]
CADSSVQNDLTEAQTAGESGLRYDAADDQFVFDWKTDKAMGGQCYELVLSLS